uniref:Putative ovule protein n=1 Tax=Solanum chacoense TaxID=4108 RepID=A0A0V0IVP3_SOLCH
MNQILKSVIHTRFPNRHHMIRIQGELRLPFLGKRTRNDELYYEATPTTATKFCWRILRVPETKTPMKLFESFLISKISIFSR